MRSILIVLFAVITNLGWSQDFVFELVITDNKGNADTVEIGYDSDGTNGIDTILGEENMAHKPWNKPLDVRCTNIWEDGIFPKGDTIELKRWIGKLNCNDWKRLMHVKLDIYTDNWPITITWDSSRLQNECLNYSVISDRWVQHWFDIASANNIDLCMGGIGTGIFDRHESIDADHVRYEELTGDTIFFVYVGLGNEWITNTSTSPPSYCDLMTSTTQNEEELFRIYNNCVYLMDNTLDGLRYRLYSVDGKLFESGRIESERKCFFNYKGMAILELSFGDRLMRKLLHIH
jgi:hypothetical protein